MSEPIDAQCRDPIVTRRRAEMGEPTPCHRCLAYLPETKSGCLFVERGVRPKRPHATGILEDHPEQGEIWKSS